MLPRHKKALSEMKSAEKRLNDARSKYAKTKEGAAKALKGVKEAKLSWRPRTSSGSPDSELSVNARHSAIEKLPSFLVGSLGADCGCEQPD